jgi:hypothetical protein
MPDDFASGLTPDPPAGDAAGPEPPPAGGAPGEESVAAETAAATATSINEFVVPGLEHLEHNFIFRKLGVCYDYASASGDFPRSTLPRGEEARNGQPNAAGIGTGMAQCSYHLGLLMDGYLARLELGLSRLEEDRILDRFVAGLIRSATTGPEGRLVRGIAPDGRSFYPAGGLLHQVLYGHALRRACESSTIAPDSQAKLRDICGKWLRRLRDNEWDCEALTPEEGRLRPDPAAADPLRDWIRRISYLQLVAVGVTVSGDREWSELWETLDQGADALRLSPELPAELQDGETLVAMQVALTDLMNVEIAAARHETCNLLRRKIAHRCQGWLDNWRGYRPPEELPALDWRQDLPAGDAPEAELWQRVYQTWPALAAEVRAVRPAMQAALVVMLSGDEDLVGGRSGAIAECLRQVPWPALLDAGSLAPLPLVHALGHERDLWDPLQASPLGETPFGEQFTCEFEEGHEPLPATGPRPKGWRKPKRELPKVVRQLESGGDGGKQKGGSAKRGGKSKGGRRSRKRGRRRGSRKRGKGGGD